MSSKIIKSEEEEIKNKAVEGAEFLNLKHLSNELAGNLSGGQKKLLELGRTMMVDANLVLLDEVGAGVNQLRKAGYYKLLQSSLNNLLKRLNKS